MPHSKKTHEKLTNLIEAGLTNMEVLKAATSLPAKLHNLNDRGVIASGKRADLMLLNSDPLVNMSSTLDIARVWIEGIEYEDVATLEWATH
ncbi:hypothetical protein NW759_008009 [Fusarium solani]|jgi:imidazolonepropionase-like amidohydrolase|nr:hypothetical protein NW759_008009 [Fusarium solani]